MILKENINIEILKTLTEHMPDMAWIKRADGRYIYANHAICKGLLMADPDEVYNQTDVFFALREREKYAHRPDWHTFGELCFNSDETVIEENKNRDPNDPKPMRFIEYGNVKGKLLYLEVFKAPIFDEEGNVVATVGSGRDITELMLKKLELKKYEQIVEQINDCIITTDMDRTITSWNKSAQKIFGYTLQEISQLSLDDIFDKNTLSNVFEICKEKDCNKFTSKLKKSDDTFTTCEITVTSMKDVDDKLEGYIFSIKDIEENIKLQKEVAKQENIITNQAHSAVLGEMIGNIAHQWRQPLSAITTLASGLLVQKQMGLGKTQNHIDNLNTIINQGKYLSETIDTFRNFAKENKELKDIDIYNVIKKAMAITKYTMKDAHIKVIDDIKINEPIKVCIVEDELTHVFINILNNAKDAHKIKKIVNPFVKFDMHIKNDFVEITIEDNAGGIPKEIINRIFEPYFTTKHKSVGTGLGLHMSYKIITESLKGRISVDNTKDGAKFTIEIPLQ